jgi:ribose 5-phosphate isomerase A
MVIGLGTGSTAAFFLQALGAAIQSQHIQQIRGVPTSKAAEQLAHSVGIPLLSLSDYPHPDLTIDGADDVDPQLNVIKGLGGALLREKIVAQNSKRLLIIVDESKLVPRLGSKSPLPVEVTPFAHEISAAYLASLGAAPALRRTPRGDIFITDNANYIYDCKFPSGIADPAQLQLALRSRAGIIESGLFMNMVEAVIVGSDNGTRTITRK